MHSLKLMHKNKEITKGDFLAGELYAKIRRLVLRSKAIHDALHTSSSERLYQTKGMTHDLYQSKTLETFWNGLIHFSKFEEIPILKILDSLTGLSYPAIEISHSYAKKSLNKIRKVFKAVDMVDLLEKIEKETNVG